MKRLLILLITLQTGLLASAQQQPGPGPGPEDTTSLLYAFKKGQTHGHFRYFFMATENTSGLSDYYANALGGGIKFETAPWKGFRFGISGSFIFNIGSSVLSKPDPKTNQLNKYELGLFDVQDPSNKTDLDRMEELYLKYSRKQSYVTFGKQLINTPFINPQDGRMRPTEVGGLYGEFNELKNTRIVMGYLYQVSPRSTVKWFTVAESIGIYPQGVNADGTKSCYAGNLKSAGIVLLGITRNFNPGFSVKVHNVFVENIFNTLLLQADYSFPIKGNGKLVAALQLTRQDAVGNGGNADQAKTYFTKGGKSQTLGAKWGWENKRWQASLNYNRITADGRYLMPREWGRDPFFTFLPRERNEGLGDVHAYVLKAGYSIPKLRLQTLAGFGYFDLPAATNAALNKYGMPSYHQLNLEVRYEFEKLLKGLQLQVLFVYKGESGDSSGDSKYVINKVDMSSWNFVMSYHF